MLLFSWEQGWIEVRSQNITALWVCYTTPGSAEHLSQWPCRAAQAAQRFMATQFTAMGRSGSFNIGMNVQSIPRPDMILLCFIAGKFLLSKLVVLDGAVSREVARCLPHSEYFPNLWISWGKLWPANRARSNSKRSCNWTQGWIPPIWLYINRYNGECVHINI